MYRAWPELLPLDIEACAVQPPGRESRIREEAWTDLQAAAEGAAEAVASEADRPYAFFGHSMGALLAFEAARHLSRTGRPGPIRLFVSARRAPSLPPRDAPIHELPDDAFVASVLERYGGIPDEILRHPDVLRLFLPRLRADMKAFETYRYSACEPLACPITAFGGRDDARVSAEDLVPWRLETAAAFEILLFAGGHFFLHSARPAVVSAVVRRLSLTPGDAGVTATRAPAMAHGGRPA